MQNVSVSTPSASSAAFVTYATWRTELERIVRLARSIAHDERMRTAVAVVTGESPIAGGIGADRRPSRSGMLSVPLMQPAATATAPSFLERILHSTSTNSIESPSASPVAVLPRTQEARIGKGVEAVSLLQLLALAEMPPSAGTRDISWPSSSAVKQRLYAEALEAVSISITSSSQGGSPEGGRSGNAGARSHSLISHSHAILPMRETASAPLSAAATPHTPFPASAGTWRSSGSGGDREGDFDLLFSRLKHQAVERSRGVHTVSSSSCSASSPTTVLLPPAAVVSAGLDAAREALDAADELLLRLRRQYRISTAPNGRLAEAQTLLVRATICREAQLYTDTIVHAVSRCCNTGQEVVEKPAHMRSSPCHRPSAVLPPAPSSALLGAVPQDWAALTSAESRDPLMNAIRRELGHFTQAPLHSPCTDAVAHGKGGSSGGGTEPRVSSSSPMSSSAPSTTSETTLFFLSASPQLKEALARWRQVVERQQRSLRMEEVHDYVAASQLFLAAAAEEQQLGGGGDTREPGELCCESPLMLATHGVTHVLRACSLLLSDTLLSKEVPYPATAVREMVTAAVSVVTTDALADELSNSRRGEKAVYSALPNQVALPPLLARAGPHATRVWMLLAQLASFLERSALQLPWDTKVMATDATSSTSLADNSSSSSTTQLLWELSAAVLLHRPFDALQALHDVVEHTFSHVAASAKVPSLRDLFSDYMSPPRARPSSSSCSSSPPAVAAALAAPSTSNAWIAHVQAQSGTLPLCLLSLHRAIAAAVRARHYAEALLDVEVGLHLLREQAERPGLVHSDGHKSEGTEEVSEETRTVDAAVVSAAEINYRRLVHWPKAESATQIQRLRSATVSTTKTVASTVTYLSDSVVLAILRVLLLFLTSPVASGEAVARLQQRQHSTAPWWRRATERCHASPPSSGTSSLSSPQECRHDDPLECAGDAVRCVAVSLTSALETLDSLTAQLQLLERHVILPQCSTARSTAASSKRSNVSCRGPLAAEARQPCAETQERFGASASEEAHLLPSLPNSEHRLEHAVATALKAATTGWTLCDARTPATSGIARSEAMKRAPTTAVDEATLTECLSSHDTEGDTSLQRFPRSVCTLTSSTRYQQLKHAHRSRLPFQVGSTACSVTPTDPGADASSTLARNGDELHDDSAHVADVHPEGRVEAHRDDKAEGGSRRATQSAALAELAQVVRELWMMVGALTLPLRAGSTCTTPPTAASVAAASTPLAPGESWFEESATTVMATSYGMRESWPACESGMSYTEARLALPTVEPRMERCLHVLGGRDRTVLILMRRLQTDLLFPAVCRPLA
ncbi:hypothetical protein, unknown function [Leishmania tarentolae]|uniref:Uncharacterized protein n=1 Tax=Leishmania tarentolae TaxID=5689 RepID=A0A640KC60_LEITA|nr:hypothetical protein, unknown function [Leishmania tarentolae]